MPDDPDDFGANFQPKFHNFSCSSGGSWFTYDLNRMEAEGDLGEMAYHGNHGMVDTKWY